MLYRLESALYFANKGDADWLKAQADVRMQQSVAAINPGTNVAEVTGAEVIEEGGGWCVRCMLAFKEVDGWDALAYCQDAYNTFVARMPWTMPNTEERKNSLNYHICRHEEGGECTIIESI